MLADIKCPSCNREVTATFTLLLRQTSKVTREQSLGIITFFMCPVCFSRGDKRSIRHMTDLDIDEFKVAALSGLHVVEMETP